LSESDSPSPVQPTLASGDASREVVASVNGSAHWYTPDGFFRRLTFSAREYDDGSMGGEWQLVAGPSILHGDILCMKILGNHARLGGFVEHSFFSFFQPNTAFGLEVVDLGEGTNTLPDKSSNPRAFRNESVDTALEFCETGQTPNPITIEDIDLGNVQIWQK
jgi:hypothetical protein